MKHLTFSLLFAATLSGAVNTATQAADKFTPGIQWNDVSGKQINAHGCCVVFHEGAYYWFGEDRTKSVSNGISCYKSPDLYNWTRVGLVFKAEQAYDETTGKCILERPKVIYNDKTGKWVMYIHWENGEGYGEAKVCVATCDRVDGAYQYESRFRPNNHDSRDQTVFKDTDGKAYHFGSTDMNTNMNVALLSEDYLTTETNPVTETKILNKLKYEAPAIIKVGDIYHGIFSGCTGWNPNPGHSASATEILGVWTSGENFAIDEAKASTYQSQSTYILKLDGYESAYIYMGDRWNSKNVGGSHYVWLPLSMRSGYPKVRWYEEWDLSVFNNVDSYKRIKTIEDGVVVQILDKNSDRWVSKPHNGGFRIDEDNEATNLSFELKSTDSPYIWKLKDVASGNFLESVYSSIRLNTENDKSTQQWRLVLEEDGYYKIQNLDSRKYLSVSGGSTFVGSNLFLYEENEDVSQSFGFYFDTKNYNYEEADMFSLAYRKENKRLMAEQKEYEQTVGIGATSADMDFTLYPMVNDGNFTIGLPREIGETTVTIAEANSGRVVHAETISAGSEQLTFDLGDSLSAGIYLVIVVIPAANVVKRMVVCK